MSLIKVKSNIKANTKSGKKNKGWNTLCKMHKGELSEPFSRLSSALLPGGLRETRWEGLAFQEDLSSSLAGDDRGLESSTQRFGCPKVTWCQNTLNSQAQQFFQCDNSQGRSRRFYNLSSFNRPLNNKIKQRNSNFKHVITNTYKTYKFIT